MECKQKQMNLTVLQINNITMLKGMGKEIINLSNFGKQYFEWILQAQGLKELYTNTAL